MIKLVLEILIYTEKVLKPLQTLVLNLSYVDSMDWKDYGVESIIKVVLDNNRLGNGSIILLHDGAKYTPEALEDVIVGLQEKGYQIAPVSQLIYTGEYKVDHTGRQFAK